MAITVPYSKLALESYLDWVEIPLVVTDDSPDDLIQYQPFSEGSPRGAPRIVRSEGPVRLPRALFSSFLSLVGVKSDETSAYIALNIDMQNDVTVNLVAVDETGGAVSEGGGAARVAGTVQIDGNGAARDVVIISDDPAGRKVVGEGDSAGDGTFDITYSDWVGSVVVIALDKYGGAFTAETALNAGTIIHPTTPNGYVYEVTTAGTTGTEEPAWSTDSSVQSGSVTFNPKPYYRPVASGPLQGEVTQAPEPEPELVPYRYYRLTITENHGATTYVAAVAELGLWEGQTRHIPINVTASSAFSGNGPELMFDQDTATFWSTDTSDPLPVQVVMDLGSEMTTETLELTQAPGSNRENRAIKHFILEGSNNSSDWVVLLNEDAIDPWTELEARSYTIEP